MSVGSTTLVNEIKFKTVATIQYAKMGETKQDAIKFSKLLDLKIKCEDLIN